MTRQALSRDDLEEKAFNLKEATGGRYKIVLEESWYYERPEVRKPDRRWFEQIPCRGGAWIGLYCETRVNCSLGPAGCCYRSRQLGKTILQLWTPRVKNARVIWDQLKNEPNCKPDWMDGEAVLRFPAELVHDVAELAGARRRRRLSPDARARLIDRGIAALKLYRNRNVEDEKTAQI